MVLRENGPKGGNERTLRAAWFAVLFFGSIFTMWAASMNASDTRPSCSYAWQGDVCVWECRKVYGRVSESPRAMRGCNAGSNRCPMGDHPMDEGKESRAERSCHTWEAD